MAKYTSAKQIAANRANARKSTGPRTAAGKARVADNAVTHGLLAAAVIPAALEPYESRAEYDALLTSVRAELHPASTMEGMLVESIAANYWRLARLYRVEAGLIARRQDNIRRDDSFGAPEPHPGIAQLSAALNPVDVAALRAILVVPGAGREGYTDSQIAECARGTLATLQRQHEQALARWRQVAALEASLPHPDTAQRLGRYEAQLNRQIHRALHELRELQSMPTHSPEPQADDPEPEPAPTPANQPDPPSVLRTKGGTVGGRPAAAAVPSQFPPPCSARKGGSSRGSGERKEASRPIWGCRPIHSGTSPEGFVFSARCFSAGLPGPGAQPGFPTASRERQPGLSRPPKQSQSSQLAAPHLNSRMRNAGRAWTGREARPTGPARRRY